MTTSMQHGRSDLIKDSSRSKNFSCSLCGFKFIQRKFLKIHFNICKNIPRPTESLEVDITTLKLEPCEEETQRTELPDEHSTTELIIDFKLEELEFTETTVSGSARPLSGERIGSLETEPPEEQLRLGEHMKVHKGGKLFKCNICDHTTTQSRFLKAHKRKHARNKKLLEVYMRKLTEVKQFKCCECDKSYATHSDLIQHLKTHPIEKTFKCAECDSAYATRTDLTQHIRAHNVEKTYKCRKCDYAYATHSDLAQHIKSLHTGKKIFKCTICNYSTAHSGSFKVHIRTHTGEKPYKCTQCEYACVKRSNLTMHMRTHTGEKPFKCTQCDYASAQASVLTLHLRTHTGEKPFNCSRCDYACAQRYQLTTHMRTHTGEKPFKCTVCAYASTQRSTLTRHIRTHTKKKP